MSNNITFTPDHWLICSPVIYSSLSGHWSGEAGGQALLTTRIQQGWIELVEPEQVNTRVATLAAEHGGTVLLVFDRVDANAVRLVDKVVDVVGDSVDLRVVDWLASTLEAVVGMNCPDQALLEALQQGPTTATSVATPPGVGSPPPPWWLDYERALVHWEQTTRSEQNGEFALAYPDYAEKAIPWRNLFGIDQFGFGTLPIAEPSNDWSWVEVQVRSFAADTSKDLFSAVRRVPDIESTERWSLSRYPISGKKAVYLMFEAEADCIERYLGCRIQVLAEGTTYELGSVNEDGIAELRLEGTVDISQALVRIGKRQHKE